MKTFSDSIRVAFLERLYQALLSRPWFLAATLSLPMAASAAYTGTSFETPEAAVSALVAAVDSKDAAALKGIFGPAVADIANPDRVQATNEYNQVKLAMDQAMKIVRASDSKCILELGYNQWPFPVPLVKSAGRWFFDTEAGKEELFNRRIGKNELATLEVVRACVDAQREYASKDRDGDQVLEYAQKLESTAGAKDGLFWPAELDGEISPLGPLIASARSEGYRRKPRENGGGPEPFHGYFFKILTRQSKSAPGGKYNYIINGNMIGGFAFVAWPAEYGEGGIMTFIVNQQGQVLQKDLGSKTDKIVEAMKEYTPDNTWAISRE